MIETADHEAFYPQTALSAFKPAVASSHLWSRSLSVSKPWILYLERLGGHYLDIGVSSKIVQGRIRIMSDAELVAYSAKRLKFSDGSELPADFIVLCTEFAGNIKSEVTKIIGKESEDKLEDY